MNGRRESTSAAEVNLLDSFSYADVVTETHEPRHCVSIQPVPFIGAARFGTAETSSLTVKMAKRWYEQVILIASVLSAACNDQVAPSAAMTSPQPMVTAVGASTAPQSSSTSQVVSAGKGGERSARATSLGVAGTGAPAGGAGGPAPTAAQSGSGGMAEAGSGGMVQGGSGTGRAGSGGVAQAGSAGMNQAGSDAAGEAPVPSAGCAKRTPRPASGAVMTSDRIYNFPSSYDGITPAPLLLALHAAGNPNTQLQRITERSKLETDFVRAFPKSAGNAWVYNTDIEKLSGVLDELLAEYCIDERRIFATGHSSGAQMVVQMLCKGEQRFRAVAPVAASKYCAELSPVPVLYIQGQMDAQRGGGNGEDVVRVFQAGNGCGARSAPLTSVASCTSSFDRKDVTPGCVTYEGCSVPTLWCSHDDNGYNNSDGRQHGWPCFANGAIADFFLSF